MKVFQYVALLSAGFLLVQCDKSDPEVVRFDDSYSVTKPNAGTRDQAPATNLLDLYGAFTRNEIASTVFYTGSADSRTITSNPAIAIKIEGSFVPKSDVVFKLVYDEEKGATSGKTIIPASALTIPESVTLATGSIETTANVTISDDYLKTLAVGEYSFYLNLTTEDANVAGLRAGRSQLLVNVTIAEVQAPEEEVEATPSSLVPPIGATKFRDGYTLSSTYQQDHVWKLTDDTEGEPNILTNWWVDTQSEDPIYLYSTFNEVQRLRGIHFICLDPQKRMGEVSVWVAGEESDNPNWVLVGTYSINSTELGEVFINFPTPLTAKYISLTGFRGTTSDQQYIDIHDLEFYR